MNSLQFESSPYLRQHAHNPVHWQAWNPQTLEQAKVLDRPVLVSIGYSTCHWCHVMEAESFLDTDIAEYMNHHFINIKIDREERPDLDSVFMDACQVITGKGGWPLHVFLTPEGKPFYAGTYFPPEPGRGRMSWTQALQYVFFNFSQNRKAVEIEANWVMQKVKNQNLHDLDQGESQKDQHAIGEQLKTGFFKVMDPEAGGFGKSAKFPNIEALEFLLSYAKYQGCESCLNFVDKTLQKMVQGGIYDQLAGGISRYTVDRFWRIPHFEKMLYDNAAFVALLGDSCKTTGHDLYRYKLEESIDFVLKNLMDESGGFYAGIDADLEGEEGKYYTWSYNEFRQVLGPDASLLGEFYGVKEGGNWEGKNILWNPISLQEFLAQKKIDEESFSELLFSARQKLLLTREERDAPFMDKKMILGWNAMMISAMAKSYSVNQNEVYRGQSLKSLDFVINNFVNDENQLFRYRIHGQGKGIATLSDYAFLIKACLDVFQISFDLNWLYRAEQFAEKALILFSDAESPFFYETATNQEHIFYRKMEFKDVDYPSSNAVMAWNLDTLGILLGRVAWQERAWLMLENVRERVLADPISYAFWAKLIYISNIGRFEIAVSGKNAISLAHQIHQMFLPGKILIASTLPNDELPLLAHRWDKEITWIYLCHNFACRRPVQTIPEFKKLLGELNEGRNPG